MARWQEHPALTVTEHLARRRAATLAQCRQGTHRLIATFRAGEQVCTSCGIILYCPECLTLYHLPVSRAERVYPLPCATHRTAEVQA